MKKLLFITSSAVLFWSCTKELTNKNTDPKNPTIVPSYTLFSNAQKNLTDVITTSDVNTNIFRLLAQQWTETTYTDESNYDLTTRNIPRQWWNVFYRDVLINLAEAKKLIPNDVPDAGQQKNELATADILQVLSFYYLVTTYGDIPYTEALDYNITQPKYDNAATLYADLLKRLDADIAALNTGSESFGGSDLIYGGDVAAWKKFANSLKLKMGILIADSDPATAKTAIEGAAPNVFTSNADNAVFAYLSSPPNTNPVWADQVLSGRQDFVVTTNIIDTLKKFSDPRIPLFFTVDQNGGYTGGEYGSSNNYAALSKPSATVFATDYPSVILSYAEVEFYLAEAAARGFNVGGTPGSHYTAGITASIEEWGGTPAAAAAYLALPSVSYATAAGDWKQKIGKQAWIALFSRGYDAWTEWRRLDAPNLILPVDAVSGIPLRFTYTFEEPLLNKANYQAAVAAIPGGQDVVEAKLWFDK